MASSLEIAKLITAGYLYNYWEKINKVFRWYLVTGVVILVLITSLGIYGFLTSPFQDTFNMFSQMKNKKHFYNKKKSSTLMMLQDMMRNLKEYLITSLLFPILGLNKSKYETPRWLEALEPRYPRLSYVWHKVELMWKKKIGKMFNRKEK